MCQAGTHVQGITSTSLPPQSPCDNNDDMAIRPPHDHHLDFKFPHNDYPLCPTHHLLSPFYNSMCTHLGQPNPSAHIISTNTSSVVPRVLSKKSRQVSLLYSKAAKELTSGPCCH